MEKGYRGGRGGHEGRGGRGDRGGYGGRGGRGGGGRGRGGYEEEKLGGGPTRSSVKPGNKITLISNHFKLNIKNKGRIFTYVALFTPDISDDEVYLRHRAIRSADEDIKNIFGQYLFSGQNLFSSTEMEVASTEVKGHDHTISIERVGSFNLEELEEMSMSNLGVALSFINMIIKKVLRTTNLKQIGRLPRFFLQPNKNVQLGGLSVSAWPGYQTSTCIYKAGFFLLVETINKFMRNDSCLTIMHEILDNYRKDGRAKVEEEFINRTVMTNYGNKRTYIVNQIDWKNNPEKCEFKSDSGEKSNVLDYFKKRYKITIKDKQQPVFVVNRKRGPPIHLVPELLVLAGLPSDMMGDRNIRRELDSLKTRTPTERFDKIDILHKLLVKNPIFDDFGVEMAATPAVTEGRVLYTPQILDPKSKSKTVDASENTLRNLSIIEPRKFDSWVLVYSARNFNQANELYENMQKAATRFGVEVKEPEWVELDSGANDKTFSDAVQASIDPKFKFILILIDKEYIYKLVKKNIQQKKPIISQVVRTATVKKGLSAASNIIKQINTKLGGDLYRMEFPKQIPSKTMLVGFDVCHEGTRSTIGFCATTDKNLTKYYSCVKYQNKGQEIINENLKSCFGSALDEFSQTNKFLPEYILIYRDGVGNSQREQVIKKELPQLKGIIEDKYNKLAKPKITFVLVNKRIGQRFFEKAPKPLNPPSGTIVDHSMIEEEDKDNYDFYLIPQDATQGTVQPTHFYIAYDDSGIEKKAIEQMTYTLCFFYFNWSGSIKVPAPCQYAHKLALYTNWIKCDPHANLRRTLHFL